MSRLSLALLLSVALAGCGHAGGAAVDDHDAGDNGNADLSGDLGNTKPGDAAAENCGTPTECGVVWEQNATAALAAAVNDPTALLAFAHAVPKGGDLHNHLSGAVYAETVIGWGIDDGNCVNTTSFSAVAKGACSTSGNAALPMSGTLYDQIIDAWSMRDFVAGAQTGHDHFFATFGKFGTIAGTHRDDSIADLLRRAADENQVYLETMFNLGTNVGALSASLSSGALTADGLQALYDQLIANGGFAAALGKDSTAVTNAATNYRGVLDCSGLSAPAACDVRVKFIAQIARTGANDMIFGQLVSAFEMAAQNPDIVGANLSSPEDDSASLNNYELHMQMIKFLRAKYTATQKSPLHITLHAGELTAASLPSGSMANTFHIRDAVEIAAAERIGHGLDVASETNSDQLLDEMHTNNVLVEICFSSNQQILNVAGSAHPIGLYLSHNVPVALGTDDQGVSRSSLAGEFVIAARDHQLDYRMLKTMARQSLEHAFLPGASLWTDVTMATPVAACAATDTNAVGGTPSGACSTYLATNERASAQWTLEQKFRAFEQQQ